VAMQTTFTEIFSPFILVLIKQESIEPFHIAVVRVLPLLDNHQVYSLNIAVFFADSMHNHTVFFPTKYVYG